MKRLPLLLPVLILLAACASTGSQEANIARAKAYREKGDAAYDAGAWAAAIEHYTECIRTNPEFAEAYYLRGNCWRMLATEKGGKTRSVDAFNSALGDYTAAVNRNPMHYDAFLNRACLLITVARAKDAVADFLQCTSIRTKDPLPHLYLGEIYEKWFEDKKLMALDHYEKYAERGGTDPDVLEKVAQFRQLKKDMQPAPTGRTPNAEDEKKAAEMHKEVMALVGQGKRDEAIKKLDELFANYGHTKYVKENRGLAALRAAFPGKEPPK